MRFQEAELDGAWVLELDPIADQRGWFARSYDRDEFRARGISTEIIQCNISFNTRRGTLRGMHFQAAPHGEPKLVRCVRGRAFDVAVDLRPQSATYCRWQGIELSAENGRAFYIPDGLAHGFQTLSEDCELHYLMGEGYVAEAARGVRFDDPAFAIDWPDFEGERTISERDRTYPDFNR